MVADTARLTVFDEICLTLVAPEWPRAPWFNLFRRVAEQQFRVDGHVAASAALGYSYCRSRLRLLLTTLSHVKTCVSKV